MGTNVKLSKDENIPSVDPTLYRSMIGSFLHLTARDPDICYSVGVCARYQANPKESHLVAIKRIICYVNGTIDFGIWYSKDTNMNLVGLCDADWARNVDNRKKHQSRLFLSWKQSNILAQQATEFNFTLHC